MSEMKQRSSASAGQPAKDDEAQKAYDAKLGKVRGEESKIGKIIKRSTVGIGLMGLFTGIVAAGHVAMCCAVFLAQVMLFRELVNVRLKPEKSQQVPMFRTVQWAWFLVAMFYVYGSNFADYFSPDGTESRYLSWFSFGLYWFTFVITVLSLKKDLYKYQMGQLTWTAVCLGLIVGQLKSVVSNILHGMFWFVFPMTLVIFNDISAYFCGLLMGRKIIKVPFLPLSPNKTWEGFGGAAIFTVLFGFLFPVFLCKFPSLVCPAEANGLDCVVHPIFLPKTYTLPTQIAAIAGMTEVTLLPIQLHGIAFGTFASLVAPFGGFFASAIKRAYKIKDFDNLLPGHGGLMDRFDCQFLMQLCVSVHFQTFVQSLSITVPFVMKYINQMSVEDQTEILKHLKERLETA